MLNSMLIADDRKSEVDCCTRRPTEAMSDFELISVVTCHGLYGLEMCVAKAISHKAYRCDVVVHTLSVTVKN